MADEPVSTEEYLKRARESGPKNAEAVRKVVEAGRLPADSPPKEWDDDLIPDADPGPTGDRSLVDALKAIPILDVYVKYGGDTAVSHRTSKTELDLRCPVPAHVDNHPSTSFNTEKGLWHCHVCADAGEGDGIDLAAAHYGYAIPGYRKRDFGEVVKKMADDFGIQSYSVGGEARVPRAPEPTPVPAKAPLTVVENSPPLSDDSADADVFEIHFDSDDDVQRQKLLERHAIDWEPLVGEGTFMQEWMEATEVAADVPREFFFWQGLQALGFATRRDLYARTTDDVPLRFFLILYGATGTGKSRAIRPFKNLIEEAFDFQDDSALGIDPVGVKHVSEPGSGEALLQEFSCEVMDGSGKKRDHWGAVTGFLEFSEFSGMVNRANRTGSTLKTRLMEFYDATNNKVRGHAISSGYVVAQSPFLQITSTTQPEAVSAFMGREDLVNGFLNRWVYVYGPQPRYISLFDLRKPELKPAVESLQETRRWVLSRKFSVYEPDGPGATRFQELDRSLSEPLSKRNGMLGRVRVTMVKLAMAFAVNENASYIRESHFEKAYSLLDYLEAGAAAFSTDVSSDMWTKAEGRVLRYIEKHSGRSGGRGVKRKEVAEACKGGTLRSTEIRGAIDMLISLGRVEEIPPLPGERAPTLRVAVLGGGTLIPPS